MDAIEDMVLSLLRKWQADSRNSAAWQKVIDPCFIGICRLGDSAVPGLLRILESGKEFGNVQYVITCLDRITEKLNDGPQMPQKWLNKQERRQLWLEWGREKGYL